jgi:hypothetical protein
MLLYQRVSHNIPIFDFTQNGRTWPYPTPASLFRGPFKHRTTSSLGDTRTWQELPPTYLGVKTNIGMKKNMGKVRKKWCVGESIRISWCFISTYIYIWLCIYTYIYICMSVYICIYSLFTVVFWKLICFGARIHLPMARDVIRSPFCGSSELRSATCFPTKAG